MSRFDWMSNPQYLAQVGHFFGAMCVVETTALVHHAAVYWVFGIGAALAALKEFVFDVAPWGEGDSWIDSAMDFAFYMLGGVAGLWVSIS